MAIKDSNIAFTSKIWHPGLVNIYGANIGENCSIGAFVTIKPGAVIGDNVRIQDGVFIPEKTVIGNNVFIGPGVTFTNDKYPTVETTINKTWQCNPVVIEDDVSIGAGCAILPGVRIGSGAKIGAGSVITKDVDSNTIIYIQGKRFEKPCPKIRR